MNNSIHFAGKLGLIAALASTIVGCVTHVHNSPEVRTVYVPAPAPEPYTPPPAPVVVQPAPVVIQAPAPIVIQAPAPVVEYPAVIHTEADFHAPLSPYGEWVVVQGYGRVWRPRHVDVSWRPYAVGRWEWTEVGWYWVSEEPWGWATYHYGRWDWTPEYGWIWAPQTQWAPAWVTWREGANYIGWAPLPPTAHISINGALEIHGAIAASRFCFVETPRLMHPVRPANVIVNNTTIINQTINVTQVKVVNHVVINEGPRTDNIERATGRRLHRNSISEVRQRDEDEARVRRGRDHLTEQAHTPNGHESSPNTDRQVELGGIRSANPETPVVTAPPVAAPPAIAQPQAQEPVRTHPTRTDRQVEREDIHPTNPATPSAAPQVVTAPSVAVAPAPAVAQPQAPEPVRTHPTHPTHPVKQAPQHDGGKPEKAEHPVALNNTRAPEPAVEPPQVRQTGPRIDRQPPGQSRGPAPVQPTALIQPAPAPAAISATPPVEPERLRNTPNPVVTHSVVAPPQVSPSQVQTNHGPAEADLKSPKKDKKANDKSQDKNQNKDQAKQ